VNYLCLKDSMIRYILIGLIFFTQTLYAQKINKADKTVISNLKKTVTFLADDKLEGRRTGTAGEKLAYEFIQAAFKSAGLQTFTANKNYVQAFEVNEGRGIGNENYLIIGDIMYSLEKEDFPFAFSGEAKDIDLKTIKSSVEIIDLAGILKENENNPHFDLKDKVYTLAKNAQTQKKQAVIFKNTSSIKDGLAFDGKDKSEKLQIPVIYLTNKIAEQLGELNYSTTLGVMIKEKKRTGHNVIGYINNNATSTIILGAHYDHLGYGEDHNSLHTGTTPAIHNGADDNASGTAALIELSKWLKKSAYKKYNYLFVSFSGEELGLFGSKYFTDNAGLDLKTVNYMINMDMVGRLNDSTHGITIGGYGTSPTWGKLIKKEDTYFKINIDSSGSGPSDHTSFYKKDIPVLFFFTGSHKDYHKPTDDADKINYAGELQIIKYIQNIIAQTNSMDKLAFAKTREVSMGKSSFKVSLGVMPDYTFSGTGVLVDGVSENRPAQKAGIKVGDVLIQLGEHKFTDVQSYMGALNKFNKGETTNVKVKRGNEELNFQITF
jgi:aminopeptidase YwaD